jgi:hypothetical protein
MSSKRQATIQHPGRASKVIVQEVKTHYGDNITGDIITLPCGNKVQSVQADI